MGCDEPCDELQRVRKEDDKEGKQYDQRTNRELNQLFQPIT